MERVGDRHKKMAGYCLTDQSPQRAVVLIEEEEEEEEEGLHATAIYRAYTFSPHIPVASNRHQGVKGLYILVKFAQELAMKAQRESGGLALPFL